MSLFYEPHNRLGASTIVINWKRLEGHIWSPESAVKKVRVQSSSTGEVSSSAVSEVNNENVLMEIVSNDAEDLVAETDTVLLESALRKFCRIF